VNGKKILQCSIIAVYTDVGVTDSISFNSAVASTDGLITVITVHSVTVQTCRVQIGVLYTD